VDLRSSNQHSPIDIGVRVAWDGEIYSSIAGLRFGDTNRHSSACLRHFMTCDGLQAWQTARSRKMIINMPINTKGTTSSQRINLQKCVLYAPCFQLCFLAQHLPKSIGHHATRPSRTPFSHASNAQLWTSLLTIPIPTQPIHFHSS
jgi:hypothetical protein